MKVADVLKGSSEVLTIKEDDDLALAGQMMAWARIRHLPVVRDDRVVGLLSQTDVLRHRSAPAEGAPQRVAAAMSQPAEVIGPEAELAEASARMLDRRLGCLPVVDSGRLIGIVTTSDILAVHVQATRAAPAPITVADVMTRAPHTARPEDNLLDAIVRMSRAGIRHLPVVDDGFHVLGMLSDRDIRDAVGDPADANEPMQPTAQDAALLQVGDIMSSPAMTVNQREELVQVTGDLVDQRVGAFAVIDDRQHLVGMLSYVDVLSAVYRHGRGRDQPKLAMAAADKRRP